jgi:hypothetical protein
VAQSRVAAINAFLDTPILDTNERGGPLEPLKAWVRAQPEPAQIAASVIAVSFFAAICSSLFGLLLR